MYLLLSSSNFTYPQFAGWHKILSVQQLIKNNKLLLYKSGHPLGFQDVEVRRMSRQLAHEGGKVVRPTHRPHLPTGDIPSTQFCQKMSHPRAIVRPEIVSQ